jgi:hypothetical protein
VNAPDVIIRRLSLMELVDAIQAELGRHFPENDHGWLHLTPTDQAIIASGIVDRLYGRKRKPTKARLDSLRAYAKAQAERARVEAAAERVRVRKRRKAVNQARISRGYPPLKPK